MADVPCPKCRWSVPLALTNTGRPFPCGGCGVAVVLDVFPAAWREAGGGGTAVVGEGAASCFFHAARPAQAACEGCGRFLCALCDVPVGGASLCPECLERSQREGSVRALVTERISWGRFTLLLAALPLLLWPITLVTAPAVLYLVVRHWKNPGSLVERGWPRLLLAGAIAGAQLVGWIAFFAGLFFL